MDFLAQGGAGLLLGPAAPKQFGEPGAELRAGLRLGDDGQQRARLPPRRQHAFTGERPGFHLADEAQTDGYGFLRGPFGARLRDGLGSDHHNPIYR